MGIQAGEVRARKSLEIHPQEYFVSPESPPVSQEGLQKSFIHSPIGQKGN